MQKIKIKQFYQVEVSAIDIITENEMNSLGCKDTLCTDVPSWVYETTYWIRTATNTTHLYAINTRGDHFGTVYTRTYNIGLRPVITLPISKIK